MKEAVRTTILISNLHCSSCVKTIQETLNQLTPAPYDIRTSIVHQSVYVEHDPELTVADIRDALDAAGFDLISTPVLEQYKLGRAGTSLSSISRIISRKQAKHAENCLTCRNDSLRSETTAVDSTSPHAGDVLAGAPGRVGTLSPIPSLNLDVSSTVIHEEPLPAPPIDEGPYNVAFSVGGMTCASCVGNVTNTLTEISGVSNVAVNLIAKSATATVDKKELLSQITEAVTDSGYECEVVSVEPVQARVPKIKVPVARRDQKSLYRASFSVGGMTCAACVGNVTLAVKDIPGVSDVAVNLVGKSATAILQDKSLAKQFVEAVEDGGYEAELITIEPLNEDGAATDSNGPRSVALKVEGMFCNHCPEKIARALDVFGDKITIDEPLNYSSSSNVLKITYTPAPPEFSLRDIVSVIENAKSPPYEVTIAKPPSLEERARLMHEREQYLLLMRLLSAVVLAIPTFIIGIVYMTLVPSSNRTRMWFMQPIWAGNVSRAIWALFILATPAMFYSAGTFHRRSIKEIYALWRPGSRVPIWRRFARFGSMNMLVSFGVAISYFSSIALLGLAAAEAPDAHGDGSNSTYFDSVVFLSMFLLSGRYLEAYSKGRTADAVTALGKLRPTEALLVLPSSKKMTKIDSRQSQDSHARTMFSNDADLEKGKSSMDVIDEKAGPGQRIEKTAVDFLEVGDIVRVPHGATPPADGVVISSGEVRFDESSLTGESRPIKKKPEDEVYVGTINVGSAVDMRVTTLGGETMLDQIVKVVREGQTKRAPIEKLADLVTGFFVPVITLLAILTWVIWLGLGQGGVLPQSYLDIAIGGWPVWALEFAIAVFVVACPCGIGLAAPTALLVGGGLAAKFGILVRGGGEAFQEAAQLDLIVFDKTGTLTEGGEPKITDVYLRTEGTPWSRTDVLSIAHALENASSHPLASALRAYCEAQKDIKLSAASSDIAETAGRGLKGTFLNPKCTAIVGNEAWMEAHGVVVDAPRAELLERWKGEGKSVIGVAMRSAAAQVSGAYTLVAIFAAADALRPEARAVIAALQKQGLSTWMISGDNATTARAVAARVGIPETNVVAGVLPHEKAEKIAWLQQVGVKRPPAGLAKVLGAKRLNERCIVAMIGDGINDAPALAAADVGIAIGSGSDVALSSASFILVKSDLRSLLILTDLSRKVFNRVKFNFLWAAIYNTAMLPIAAGVVYPAHHTRLSPVWASLAMALSSVSVVVSSLLLRLYREPKVDVESVENGVASCREHVNEIMDMCVTAYVIAKDIPDNYSDTQRTRQDPA